ncbi:MAG: molecular chaperone DnaK [Gammaproteobacteria bacterium]|uniref:TraR/DksA family transcriptional regulator n=1 Tax=Rhodoferax sp. TaxID=50421 RepID=UPI0017FFB144|nr:molecular chaperone DnaK [Rhodoferax sp.]MBU3900323.1 molecular chaperone DnaK [Gammaproteobacteria bacterium]MBA3058489.1 molecular chaperone DnaK [Rhodoferax sp.]MBU3998037.1 molecular chaperone DnaK [Gammaproteobacteria bacterium]MBU4018910.1 molecular chaperone DnaK [Gammaproteobacteria bacterium]MBU4080900.1 molecular chaperone DnaK [Gammaproteobacteria bacterium]
MQCDFEFFRQRLLDEITRLDISMREAQGAMATVVLDQTSVGRIARMDALQQQAMAKALHERMQVSHRRLRAALNRINAETFGICCQCDDELDSQQLNKDPAAVFCLACIAEKSIPGRGQFGY